MGSNIWGTFPFETKIWCLKAGMWPFSLLGKSDVRRFIGGGGWLGPGFGKGGYTHHNVVCPLLPGKCMLHWQWHNEQISCWTKISTALVLARGEYFLSTVQAFRHPYLDGNFQPDSFSFSKSGWQKLFQIISGYLYPLGISFYTPASFQSHVFSSWSVRIDSNS